MTYSINNPENDIFDQAKYRNMKKVLHEYPTLEVYTEFTNKTYYLDIEGEYKRHFEFTIQVSYDLYFSVF